MVIGAAFGLMGAFFMAGLYVAGALGCLALVLMHFFSDNPLWNIMGNKAWEVNIQFILVAVPLFILMGELMLRSGMGERMYEGLSGWVGPLPGGLIHTNIVSCSIFAACSGSSVATAATISRVGLPSFRARGYNERLVIGSLAAGGTLGILIPPSIGLILFGVLAEESIGRLYLGGFLPGLLLTVSFMIMIIIVSVVWRGTAPRERMAPLRVRVAGLLSLVPVMIIIFAVLGTIYLGVATPTEAAAFGVTGALILAVLNNLRHVWRPKLAGAFDKSGMTLLLPQTTKANIRAIAAAPITSEVGMAAFRDTFEMLRQALLSTVRTSSMIMLIVFAAFTLSFAFARLGIAHDLSEWVVDLNLSAVELVIILVVFYLLLGTFMESVSMLVTTVPILAPVLAATGVDLVWFGIIMVILVEAALISPPEGIQLYILHGIRRDVTNEAAEREGVAPEQHTITDVFIGVLPFMLVMAVVIALIIVFPDIVLWLPNTVKGEVGGG
jgi:tripartite ATP-independent transporter DctM subunit